MTEKHLKQEYTELVGEWTDAETARQRLVDRLRSLDEQLASDDPIWDEWDRADEMAGHAREAVRSFVAASGHSFRP